MERAVMRRSRCVRIPPRAVHRASGQESEREAGRPESAAMPVELRLKELGGRRRLDRRGARGRRRHSGSRTGGEAGMTGEYQQEREGDTSGERPEVTSPPIHLGRA